MADVTYQQVLPADPWEHRNKNMRCSTCMWFVLKSSDRISTPVDRILGRCRKHAPSMTGYPAVFTNDWCGDHKLDENKL
jgi:hypothetical protein